MSILFEHVTAVTMDPAAPVLHDAFVLVEGTAISQVGQTRPQGEFDRVVDCTGKVMMPGLINAHTHLPMTLMRGYGCLLYTSHGHLGNKAVQAGPDGLGALLVLLHGVE